MRLRMNSVYASRELRTHNLNRHEIFAPDDLSIERLAHLRLGARAHVGIIKLRNQMREHQGLHARALRDQRIVAMIAASRAISSARFMAADVVVHVNQHIASARQLHELVAHAAVTGVTDRSVRAIEPKRQTFEVRLHMLRVPHGDLPRSAFDRIARVNLTDARRRTMARRCAASLTEHVQTALMFDASPDVRTVDAFRAKQLLSHPRDWRRAEHVEIRNAIRALVPPLEHEPRVIHAVVVVQVAEEGVGHVNGAMPALHQPVMCARTVIHHDQVRVHREEIARTLPRQRRRRRARAQQRDSQRVRPTYTFPGIFVEGMTWRTSSYRRGSAASSVSGPRPLPKTYASMPVAQYSLKLLPGYPCADDRPCAFAAAYAASTAFRYSRSTV